MSLLSARDVTLDLLIRYGFQILGALVILGIGLVLARWVGNATSGWLERRRMEPPVRALIARAVRIVVLMFTLVIALDKFGFQVAPLVAGIGVAGLGIGIALQGVLSNVGVEGQVSAIELFSTTLVHPDGSRVVIPNRKIIGEILHNHGMVRQLPLSVQVAYGADLERALAAARDVLAQNRRVLKDPVPYVGLCALGDSGISLSVAPWVAVADYIPAQAELYHALVQEFRTRDIAIPFPQREVRLLATAGSRL